MNEIKEHRVLGRGFSSLLPNLSPQPSAAQQMIAIEKIQRNPQQPRKHFSANELNEMTESIRAKGILQPLIVQKGASSDYILIAGERRLRAATLAGLKNVPVIIRESSPQDSLEVALIENIQRSDLNPMEEAVAYHSLIDRFQLSQEHIAKKVGKNRSTIANILRLLKLPEKVQTYLRDGKITAGQARPLIALTDPKKIIELADKIVAQDLSARHVEVATQSQPKRLQPKKSTLSINLTALQDKLRRHFGTKVEVKEVSGKGTLEIHYYSQAELNRIIKLCGL